jgi:hypothetical protein
MTAKRLFLPLVLAGALLAGCDDKKVDQPKVDNTPRMPNANDMKAGMDKAADQAKTAAADQAKTAAADAGKTTADAARSATDAAKTATGNAVEATKSATSDAAAAVKTQANDWMAKLEDAIKSNKLDDAQTYVDKLDAVKASLPAEWQAKLDSLKATFSAAKAKAAIPGLNK